MEAASALSFTQRGTILLQIIISWVFLASHSVRMIPRIYLPQQETAKLNNYKERWLEAVHAMV